MNLKQLLKENPEYADMEICIYDGETGELHFLGASGNVYVVHDEDKDVLVFSGN